jgi:hypothetical protein
MVCGVVDTNIDKLDDDRVTFSKPFAIIAGQIPITAPYSPKMTDFVQRLRTAPDAPRPFHVPVWHFPLLVPKSLALDHVATLSDFRKEGGKIYREGFFP